MKDRIKKLRLYLGMSQGQFAGKIHKTPGFISLLENGRSGLSQESASEISAVLGVNEEWLLTGKGSMFKEGVHTPKADKEHAGERVRAVRKEAGLSQDAFAEKMCWSKNQICNIETGKSIPTDDFLQKAAALFSINYQWLFSGEGSMKDVNTENRIQNAESGDAEGCEDGTVDRDLIELISRLDIIGRNFLKQLIELYIEFHPEHVRTN